MPTAGRPPLRTRPSLAGWILVGSVLAALTAWTEMRHSQEDRARLRFGAAVAESQDRLERQLRRSEELIRGVRGLAMASGGIDHASFRAYLESMDSRSRYPGLLSVSYLEPVAPAQRAARLARLRAELGRPGIEVHPGWGFEGDSLVLYVEPETAGSRALGFNPASSPGQRESLGAARDTGTTQASAPTAVAQAPQAGPGLVLRLAVYRGRSVPATLVQRRATYSGCVNAVFLTRDLIDPAFLRVSADGVRLRVTDPRDSARPFMSGGGDRPARAWNLLAPRGFSATRELSFGGRDWRLEYQAGRAFFLPLEATLPWFGAGAWLVIGWLLAGLSHALSLTRERAAGMARQMTADYRSSAARLQAILRILPDVLLVYDGNGRYVEVLNQDASRLWAAPGLLLGRTVTEVLPPASAALVLQVIQVVLREQREHSVDYSLETPRGLLRFEARVIPMEPGFGAQPCVLWAARDITEREGQETASRQAQKLESLGLLAGGIAHDFNNLLTAIQGHLSLGRLAVQDGLDPAAHLDHMESSIRLAADLAQRLLAYSGRATLSIQALAVNALLEDMTTLLGVSRSKLVELEFSLAPDLPRIQADRVQVQQVIMNLVANASEAIGERPGRVRLSTRLSRLGAAQLEQRMPAQELAPGAYVTLAVEDDGEGMRSEVLARIFDPFFTTKRAGRGLGLSAIRGILHTHHAGIEIASKVGQGTTIALHFPAMDPKPEAVPAADPPPALPQRFEGSLLLAEDEPVIRELSTAMAERLGFQVLPAEDGEAAWALFQARRGEIRVAILDLTMPRMGGAEVYALIRGQSPDLPILLCSGYSREAIPKPASPAEPSAFLQKPFTFAQFSAALARLLQGVAQGPSGN